MEDYSDEEYFDIEGYNCRTQNIVFDDDAECGQGDESEESDEEHSKQEGEYDESDSVDAGSLAQYAYAGGEDIGEWKTTMIRGATKDINDFRNETIVEFKRLFAEYDKNEGHMQKGVQTIQRVEGMKLVNLNVHLLVLASVFTATYKTLDSDSLRAFITGKEMKEKGKHVLFEGDSEESSGSEKKKKKENKGMRVTEDPLDLIRYIRYYRNIK